jgi:phosphoribosylformylglycinamidine synthase subunit PurS
MKVRVDVMLKNGVLDPQGKAIASALSHLGFSYVEDVRAGKVIELDLSEKDPTAAKKIATEMAEKLLVNKVIEDYRIEIVG